MKIGILSDTHSYWDDRFTKYFSDCDEIWHAGDIGDIELLERLNAVAPVVAVAGNVDHGEVRRRCREVEIFEREGVKILLTHIGGYPGRWNKGMPALIKEHGINLIIDGHSHILRIMHDPATDVLLINPGAAGRQGWQKVRTIVRLEIDSGDIKNCEVIELN